MFLLVLNISYGYNLEPWMIEQDATYKENWTGTASTEYNPTYADSKAIDGLWGTGSLTDSWIGADATTTGTYQVFLGENQTIDTIAWLNTENTGYIIYSASATYKNSTGGFQTLFPNQYTNQSISGTTIISVTPVITDTIIISITDSGINSMGAKEFFVKEIDLGQYTVIINTTTTEYDADFDINYTVYNSSRKITNPVYCSLYENTTKKITQTLNYPNLSDNISISVTPSTQKIVNYTINCNTTLDGTPYFFNSTALTILIDNINPSLKTDITNRVLINPTKFSFNFSDPYLFSYNIKFGDTLLSNLSNIDTSTYNLSLYINPNNFTVGLHTLNVTYSDGHTAREILPISFDLDSRINRLRYKDTNDFVDIKSINTFDSTSKINTRKIIDRYLIDYERGALEKNTEGNTLRFSVNSTTPIIINSKNDFRGWLVIPDQNKWVDFETESRVGRYEVRRISPFSVEITIYDVVDDKITFNSIGELNIVTNLYQIGIANITQTYNPFMVSKAEQTMTLTIDYFNLSLIKNATSKLFYNSSQKNVTKSIVGTKYLFSSTFITPSITGINLTLPFYWGYNTTFNDDTYSYNTTNITNQIVFNLFVDNCSIATFPFLNIFIFDEENPTQRLNGTIEAEILQRYYGVESQINITLSGKSNYSICMLYENMTFFGDVYFKYKTDNGFTNRYYIYNSSYSNTPIIYNLYNFNTTSITSDLEITVRNEETYGILKDVIAKLQRKYVGEGVWRTIQMAKSGDYGELFFNIKEKDIDYRILYADTNNNLLFTTTSSRFLCTSGRCSIVTLISPYSATAITTEVDIVATYNNETNIISFDWTVPSGDSATIEFSVSKHTSSSIATICLDEITGSGGVYTCNVSGYTGSFLASARTRNSPLTPAFAEWFEIKIGEFYSVIGEESGALWSFIIVLIIVMIGIFSPVGVILGAIVGLIFIYLLGLMSVLTISLIAIASIIGIIISFKIRS